MNDDKDAAGLEKRRLALAIVRRECRPTPPSPVSLTDMTDTEAAMMRRRHYRGPSLGGLYRDMLAALPPKDYRQDVVGVDSDLHPVLFLNQAGDVYRSVELSAGRRRLEAIVKPYRLLSDFRARLENDTANASDNALVLRQQRMILPAYQAHLLSLHGAAYNDWLARNKFHQLAMTPTQQRRHDSVAGLMLPKPGYRASFPWPLDASCLSSQFPSRNRLPKSPSAGCRAKCFPPFARTVTQSRPTTCATTGFATLRTESGL